MPTTAEATKTFLDSVITPGAEPHRVLEQLDFAGIEHYVTPRGDLMIKTWQVAAEGFLSPTAVPLLQQTPPTVGDALNWVSEHLNELREQYPGQWIAVSDGAVRAAAPTLPVLLALANAQGVAKPFVTQVPAGEVLWTMTYARQDV